MKIIIITAVWCPSCLIMRPRFDEIVKKYPQLEAKIYDFDLDDEISIYHPGNILPIFILLDSDNIEKERLIGEHKVDEMIKLIETNL